MMRRVENRGEKAIRAAQKATRCATAQPTEWSDAVLTRAKGKRAEAENEAMMKPVGSLIRGAGEVFHADPRETNFDITKATLFSTLDRPNMISVTASEERMEAALKAGVLEAAVDAAETARAENSLEKMLAHQMAAAHHAAMKLIARGIDERLPPVESARLANAAARLMQVYQEALLALHKIRRGGKQVVVVQHVEVSGGGQAVIAGNMKGGTRGPKGGEERKDAK
jgi:predicted component of type VI protein secretion system